jgi:uncharacterized membrane protein
MDENHLAPMTVAAYGAVLLCASVAYFILTRVLLASHPRDSLLHKALGSDFKGKISVVIYAVAIACAFLAAWISLTLYVVVALMWLVPDRRFERLLAEHKP